MKKPIDKVTVSNLNSALTLCGYSIDNDLLDKIIDLVELIEEKGDKVRFKDIYKLQSIWDK